MVKVSQFFIIVPLTFVISTIIIVVLSVPISLILMQTTHVVIAVFICKLSFNWYIIMIVSLKAVSRMWIGIAF